MAISYNAGTNTLTLDGVNTYTLLDIYNADVAGAWGVVTHVGELYLFECNMVVGDAGGNATKLIDSYLGFQIGLTGARKTFQTLAGSSFEMTGCILKFWISSATTSYGIWKFIWCSIYMRGTNAWGLYMRGTQEHVRSEFNVSGWLNYENTGSYDTCLIKPINPLRYRTTGDINQLRIEGNVQVHYASPVFRNTTITGYIRQYTSEKYTTFINSTFGSLILENENNYLLDKWEFDLTVTDENNVVIVGATVTLKDKDGVTRHTGTTDANGKVGTWEVLANRYDGTSETKTEYTPFTLTVRKAGTNYLTYIKKFEMDEKTNWEVTMVDMSDLIEDLDDIKGTEFAKDTHSLTNIKRQCKQKHGIL